MGYFLVTKDQATDELYTFYHQVVSHVKLIVYNGRPYTLIPGQTNLVDNLTSAATSVKVNLILSGHMFSDGGTEFMGKFSILCNELGLKQSTTTPYTLETNGLVERYWQTLFGLTRALLVAASSSY
jgi:hypothetical protein